MKKLICIIFGHSWISTDRYRKCKTCNKSQVKVVYFKRVYSEPEIKWIDLNYLK